MGNFAPLFPIQKRCQNAKKTLIWHLFWQWEGKTPIAIIVNPNKEVLIVAGGTTKLLLRNLADSFTGKSYSCHSEHPPPRTLTRTRANAHTRALHAHAQTNKCGWGPLVGQAGVDLDDIELLALRVEGVLDVALPNHTEVPDDLNRRPPGIRWVRYGYAEVVFSSSSKNDRKKCPPRVSKNMQKRRKTK